MPRTLVRMVALLRTILEGTVRHVPRIAPLLQLPMAPEQTIVLQRFLEIFIILWALLPVTYIHIVPSLEPSGCAPRAACRGAVRFYCGLVVSLHRPGHPRRAAMATPAAPRPLAPVGPRGRPESCLQGIGPLGWGIIEDSCRISCDYALEAATPIWTNCLCTGELEH